MNIEQNIPAAGDDKVDLPEGKQISLPVAPGTARLDLKLNLPPGTCLEVNVETHSIDGGLLERHTFLAANPVVLAAPAASSAPAAPAAEPVREPARAWMTALSLSQALLIAALAVTLLTRLIGLNRFPIYFFTDEAVQTVLAADLVRDGFHGYSKEFLPAFFQNGGQYNLSVSVYWQVLPYILFGKSIWVTRGAAVLGTLLAAFAVWRILKDIYKSPHPWAAVLLLSITPAWFLHSRTAFETALAVSLYAGFLYLYLLYRCISPRYLYGAVALAALAFYTYSPAQMVVALTALLLFGSDLRYHWKQRAVVLRGAGLALLLALPYVRFLINHPNENLRHLQILHSYWAKEIPLVDKLAEFGRQYLRGLNPLYWYLPNNTDFVRHQMQGYSHLLVWTLPLALAGLVKVLRGWRSSQNRVLLAALLAAPSGAALAQLGITRALFMVIPAALLSALGLQLLFDWFSRHERIPRALPAAAAFVLLVGFNFYLLADALTNGPVWFKDYGLGGMQYGARQVAAAVGTELAAHPDERIILSPSWANGTNEVMRFFFPDPLPFELGSVEGYIDRRMVLNRGMLFIMIPDELERAAQSGKFQNITLDKYLPYPDGSPGFLFVRMEYIDQVDRLLAVEQESRRALRSEEVIWDGKPARVRYSTLDMGQIQDGFDGDDQSILRTFEANPLVLEIEPVQPRSMSMVGVRVGGAATRVMLAVSREGRTLRFSRVVDQTPEPRYVNFSLPAEMKVEKLRLEVTSIHDGEPAHVHLWEVQAR